MNGLLTAGGGRGQVRCKNSGKEFVIKVVDVSKCSAREREAARKECGILQALRHPNIIKLKEVLLVSEELYMVFEYLDYNLYEVYSKMKEEHKKFTEREIK